MRSWRRREQAAIFSCLVPPCQDRRRKGQRMYEFSEHRPCEAAGRLQDSGLCCAMLTDAMNPVASWLRLCRGPHRVSKDYHIFGSRIASFVTHKRPAPNARFVPCVDGSELARRIVTSQARSVQPCVRPLSAVHMTAGHNALRGSGPGQKPAFEDAVAETSAVASSGPTPGMQLRRLLVGLERWQAMIIRSKLR